MPNKTTYSLLSLTYCNQLDAIQKGTEVKLKGLVSLKRKNRARKYIDKKYQNIKFYETKKLKKLYKRAEGNAEEQEKIQQKLDYVKVPFSEVTSAQYYPRGMKYISIIKTDKLTPEAVVKRDEIFAETSKKADRTKEYRLKGIDQTVGRKTGDIKRDAFFTEDTVELEDTEKRQVDKKGNVI